MEKNILVMAIVALLFLLVILIPVNGSSVEVHGNIQGGFLLRKIINVNNVLIDFELDSQIMFLSLHSYLQVLEHFNIGGSIRTEFIKNKRYLCFIPIINYYTFFIEIYFKNISFGFIHQCEHSCLNVNIRNIAEDNNFYMGEYNGGFEEIYIKVKF